MTNNFGNENNDDFVESETGATNERGRPTSAAGNLAEAWRTRPLLKFMVLIIAVFAIGAAAVNFFGTSKVNPESARLGKPPVMKEAPGGVASPYVREQTEMANKERVQQAIASGGSAIPTPLGQPTDVSGFGGAAKKEDPLKELRAETELLKKQVQQQQQVQAQQAQQRQPEQFDNTLAEAMQRQMQELLKSWTPIGIKNVTVTKEDATKEGQEKTAGIMPTTTTKGAPQKIIVNAGTVSYAQLLTEANSDVPGPILAQIVSGPLAGARAIGSFQAMYGYEKYLVMKFTLADKNGKDYTLNAVALDPDTTLAGMATEVDERYFTRVVLPAAASFLEGLGQAMSQGNTSITTNGTTTITTQAGSGFKRGMYSGLGEAADTTGSFFRQQANVTKPLIRVAAGTPLGIFFVSPVKEPKSGEADIQQNMYQGYPPNYPPMGANPNAPGSAGPSGYAYGESSPQEMNNVPYPNYGASGYNYPRTSSRTGVSPYAQQGYGR